MDAIQADVVSLHLISLDRFFFGEFLQLLLHPYKVQTSTANHMILVET